MEYEVEVSCSVSVCIDNTVHVDMKRFRIPE